MSDIFTVSCVQSALCWTNNLNAVEFVTDLKQTFTFDVLRIFCTFSNDRLNKTSCAAYCTSDVLVVACILMMFCFRFSRWFLHLRSVPIVTHLCGASRHSLQPSRPLTTASPRCPPWPLPRCPAQACTLTQPPPPSPQRLRPWSNCWAAVTAATGTPPPPMQQRTPHPPPPGGTRPVVRTLSVVCCTASPQPTSISLPLVLPTSV